LPMEAGASLSWVEAYGSLTVDPAVAHGSDWQLACAQAEAALEVVCPRQTLETWLARCEKELDGKCGDLMQMGDGWACLEQMALQNAFVMLLKKCSPESIMRCLQSKNAFWNWGR